MGRCARSPGVSVPRAGVFTVGPQAEAPGYMPLGIVLPACPGCGRCGVLAPSVRRARRAAWPGVGGRGRCAAALAAVRRPGNPVWPGLLRATPVAGVRRPRSLARERLKFRTARQSHGVPVRLGLARPNRADPIPAGGAAAAAALRLARLMHQATVRRALVLLVAVLVLLLAIAAASGTG